MGSEKFKPSELKNIEEFFETDKDEDSNNNYVKNQKHSIFYNFFSINSPNKLFIWYFFWQ